MVCVHGEFVGPVLVFWVLEMVEIDVKEVGLSPFIVLAVKCESSGEHLVVYLQARQDIHSAFVRFVVC